MSPYNQNENLTLNSLEHRFRNVIMSAPMGITVFRGSDFIVEIANHKYLEIVDREESTFVGKALFESLPEVKEAVEPLLTNVYKTGVPYYGNEFPVTLNRYGKRELTYFNFVYQPLKEKDGKVSGIIVIANEVTDSVRFKNTLSESERQFRNLVMQSPVAMTIVKGKDYIIDLANTKMFVDVWRKKEADVIGKPLFEVFPELKQQKYPELLEKVYTTGATHTEIESMAYVQGDDGMRKFYLDYTYAPLRDTDGSIFGLMITVTDVTERVENRQLIEQEREKANLAIESGELGTYEFNFQTNDLKISQRYKQIMGLEDRYYNRDEIVMQIHPNDRLIREQAHLDAVKTGKLNFEARVIWPDGSVHWIRAKGILSLDENKKPLVLVGLIQDIDDEKQFTSELERQVMERTEELQAANEEIAATNEELSESNEHLLKLNRELEQFNYATSHDLQEPLRKIKTFINVLLDHHDEKLDDKAKQYLKKIDDSSTRMRNILDDLLLYAHSLESDHKFVPIDLNEVLENVKIDLELLIEQKQAVIKSDSLPTITAVPVQLHQLFLNLLSNAIKFSKKHESPVVRIEYKTLSVEEIADHPELIPGNQYCRLSFIDNGIGFPQEYENYVFELFKRLHPKTEYPGTGIGLSLCKKIAENHKGAISIQSVEGVGTTVLVILMVD